MLETCEAVCPHHLCYPIDIRMHNLLLLLLTEHILIAIDCYCIPIRLLLDAHWVAIALLGPLYGTRSDAPMSTVASASQKAIANVGSW